MYQIVISAIIALGMILGAQNYTEQHQKFGASQPISSLTAKTTLAGNDTLVIVDNASTPTTKKITVANASSSFKAFNDLTYSPLFSTSAGLASLLSDETGSSGGFVRAGSPSLSSPTLTTPTITIGSDATGDLYYRDSGGAFQRLAFGAAGTVLTASSTLGRPSWDLLTGTFSNITVTGSSTFQNYTALKATTTSATTTNLSVSGTASTTNLVINSTGTFNGWASSTAYEIVTATDAFNFNSSDPGSATASCTAGKVVIGGGVGNFTGGNQLGYSIFESSPQGNSGWKGQIRLGSGTSDTTFTVYAICVKI